MSEERPWSSSPGEHNLLSYEKNIERFHPLGSINVHSKYRVNLTLLSVGGNSELAVVPDKRSRSQLSHWNHEQKLKRSYNAFRLFHCPLFSYIAFLAQ